MTAGIRTENFTQALPRVRNLFIIGRQKLIALMMEALSICETSVFFYSTTQSGVSEGSRLQELV